MTDHAVNQIAADIVPQLERRLDDWLKSDMILGSKEYQALALCLWDNKVGMLRVLQDSVRGAEDVLARLDRLEHAVLDLNPGLNWP